MPDKQDLPVGGEVRLKGIETTSYGGPPHNGFVVFAVSQEQVERDVDLKFYVSGAASLDDMVSMAVSRLITWAEWVTRSAATVMRGRDRP